MLYHAKFDEAGKIELADGEWSAVQVFRVLGRMNDR
jgi:hypothetical protein